MIQLQLKVDPIPIVEPLVVRLRTSLPSPSATASDHDAMMVSNSSETADFETIAFQWTMPSIDEELFYRGVLLLMMNEAFTRRVTILGAPIGYGGLLTSLLFGLAQK